MADEEDDLDEEHWSTINRALGYLADQAGVNRGDVFAMVRLFPKHWNLLTDKSLVTEYCRQKDAAARAASRVELESALAELDALESPA